MENTTSALEFASGNKNSMTAYTNTAGAVDRNKLKFTVLPYGGFDGWNKYKTYENGYEEFMAGEDRTSKYTRTPSTSSEARRALT